MLENGFGLQPLGYVFFGNFEFFSNLLGETPAATYNGPLPANRGVGRFASVAG
jgi:hypothetical protein